MVGAMAGRLGRGPATAATTAVALVASTFFIPPSRALGIGSVSDVVRLVTGILAAAAVIQFVHVARRRESLLRRRKDLLQDVSPRLIHGLDADEVLNPVAEATLRVLDY